MSIEKVPESLSQAILIGRFLVGRLGAQLWVRVNTATMRYAVAVLRRTSATKIKRLLTKPMTNSQVLYTQFQSFVLC